MIHHYNKERVIFNRNNRNLLIEITDNINRKNRNLLIEITDNI